MKETRILMDMPITIEVVDSNVTSKDIDKIYDYFTYIDEKFSPFKDSSEISKINNGALSKENYSKDMKEVLRLCEQTKRETNGYFDISRNGKLDPSGLVKGWAIYKSTKLLEDSEFTNYYVDAGGDIQVQGKNNKGKPWKIGIRNPFNRTEIVKTIIPGDQGVATSGTYIRGQHIYNPFEPEKAVTEIVSLTVIGPNIYEADRFATAAFAMGKRGIKFIEKLDGFEGYMIESNKQATYTSGFDKHVCKQ